ncbi:MAPEG family protein [Xanthomonas massiliensis]|uniref:MAPEG family protein n=1 Tax=Xanthomonas massiliensis TaxID=1720302 RepID=UPI000824C9CD|nr:MAPEG family protein [Xanthomonas massiliensis]
MAIELRMLGWAMVLGLLQLGLASVMATRQRGAAWNAGPRDGAVAPLQGVAGRLERAWANYRETFPLFAAAVLAVMFAGAQDGRSALAVQLYFWARLAYVPVYAAGIPYLRSAIWAVSMVGVVLLLWSLLAAAG